MVSFSHCLSVMVHELPELQVGCLCWLVIFLLSILCISNLCLFRWCRNGAMAGQKIAANRGGFIVKVVSFSFLDSGCLVIYFRSHKTPFEPSVEKSRHILCFFVRVCKMGGLGGIIRRSLSFKYWCLIRYF